MRKLLYLIVVIFLSGQSNAVKAVEIPTTTPESLIIEQPLVEEPVIYTLKLDEATILKGYTFVAPDNDFKVGVVDKAVIEPITVRFKKIPDSHMIFPLTKRPG
jgi:hypothetical protein